MGSKKKYRKSFAEAVKSIDTNSQEEEIEVSGEVSADALKKQVDKDIEEEIQELNLVKNQMLLMKTAYLLQIKQNQKILRRRLRRKQLARLLRRSK